MMKRPEAIDILTKACKTNAQKEALSVILMDVEWGTQHDDGVVMFSFPECENCGYFTTDGCSEFVGCTASLQAEEAREGNGNLCPKYSE